MVNRNMIYKLENFLIIFDLMIISSISKSTIENINTAVGQFESTNIISSTYTDKTVHQTDFRWCIKFQETRNDGWRFCH